MSRPSVALLLAGGEVWEDFLDTIGVSLERFCQDGPGGWVLGYIDALDRAGIRTVVILFSARISSPMRFGQAPGTTIAVLPAPRAYRALRQLTQGWFMPQNLRKLEARIRELARGSIDRMAALGGECDFAREIALFYPLRVIMEILGVPEADEPLMLKLTQEMFAAEDKELNRSGGVVTEPGTIA